MKRLIVSAMLLTVGCKSSIAPLKGELFVLQSIASVPLPAPYAENPSLDLRIIADTLGLTSFSTGERRTRVKPSAPTSIAV